ncbi:MAG: class I SAM-dependent methyltransferase [Candidatus Curtissbacteria bacterium]|nr:class I SAM-dependent methyltransferase [Candidatus Curtissbacteria bacterium]
MAFENVSIEKIKGFWDRRPCNIRHSEAKVGTKKYFDQVEERKYFVEPHIPDFARFSKWKGKKVLEIGCGIGTDTINFARAGAKVTAIEISQKSLDLAKKRAKIFGLQNKIKFYLANAEELSKIVPIEPYEFIYSFGVIHHTPHPEKVIKEVKKYCNQNTTVKIMIYYRYAWKVLWILLKFGESAFWNLDRLIAKHSEAATGSPVTYVYSKDQARKLLKGFKILDMRIDHIFPYSIPEYKRYQYKKVWYFRYLPKEFFRRLETHFGWHLLITAEYK